MAEAETTKEEALRLATGVVYFEKSTEVNKMPNSLDYKKFGTHMYITTYGHQAWLLCPFLNMHEWRNKE